MPLPFRGIKGRLTEDSDWNLILKDKEDFKRQGFRESHSTPREEDKKASDEWVSRRDTAVNICPRILFCTWYRHQIIQRAQEELGYRLYNMERTLW